MNVFEPRNIDIKGYKPLKSGAIRYGDAMVEFYANCGYGVPVVKAVLMSGDADKKEDGLTYAVRFLSRFSPEGATATREFLYELMGVVPDDEDIVDYFGDVANHRWFVIIKRGMQPFTRVVCPDYREAFHLLEDDAKEQPTEQSPEEYPEQSPEEYPEEEDAEGTPSTSSHYKGAVEPLEVMASILTREEFIGFLKGNCIKYSYRAGHKKGESAQKDRNKFLVYSEWLDCVNTGQPIQLGDKTITTS